LCQDTPIQGKWQIACNGALWRRPTVLSGIQGYVSFPPSLKMVISSQKSSHCGALGIQVWHYYHYYYYYYYYYYYNPSTVTYSADLCQFTSIFKMSVPTNMQFTSQSNCPKLCKRCTLQLRWKTTNNV